MDAHARRPPSGYSGGLADGTIGFLSLTVIYRLMRGLLFSALSKGAIGPYQLQAAISAVHANASEFANTDWAEITGLYERLYQSTPTPVVRLNAIVALSYAKDAALALLALNDLEATGALSEYQYFYVVKADLLERTSQIAGAQLSLTRAIQLATNKVERTFLEKKLLQLSNK